MKKTIAAFLLGGLLTAGAFGLVYSLPITSAAEKAAQAWCGGTAAPEGTAGTYCN